MKELLIRLMSGIIIVLLIFFVVLKGGILMSSLILILSIIGLNEFYAAMANVGTKPLKTIGSLVCIGIFIDSLDSSLIPLFYSIIIFAMVSSIVLYLKKKIRLNDILVTLFGIVYIPILFQYIIYLDGSINIWLVFIIAWGTDTFAYVIGNILGRTKLCPKLSPKKTVEGSIGGIIGVLLSVLAFAQYYGTFSLRECIIISILGSIVAQIGDLTASKIKRITGIKDYGFIMPGHGGILDRFDSILFTAPFVYYFISFLL